MTWFTFWFMVGLVFGFVSSFIITRLAKTRGRIGLRFEVTTETMTIPPEIATLIERLRTQDTLATAWPLYRVEQRKRISGIDQQFDHLDFEWHFSDDHELRYSNEEVREAIAEGVDLMCSVTLSPEQVATLDPEEHGYEKVYYIDTREVVTAHFTMAAAEEYISANRHNLASPRVFVTSQHRCPEWQAVTKFLLAIEEEG
ncbi:MAG: hypothetical protein ABH877_02700 [bacterium]